MNIYERWSNTSVRGKMTSVFLLTTLMLFFTNLFMYVNINVMIRSVDEVYASNIHLNELSDTLDLVQQAMTSFLNTRSTDAMEGYYRASQKYSELTYELNSSVVDNQLLLTERNIKNVSERYLEKTNQAIDAKRGGNIEKYKSYYDSATLIKDRLTDMISTLNNKRFRYNADNYQELSKSLRYLEMINMSSLVLIGLVNLMLVIFVTRNITEPLKRLASAANQVAGGDLSIEKLPVEGRDEVGIVTGTFNQMVDNISEYIEEQRKSMLVEQEMKEKALLMETHLKDARLKYLQAQINPHFLFNTLNAGAQLAMMEDADSTYSYIQKVADFFRYNVKKDHDTVSLKEEIALVDTYIYILNVRFSGEIHFSKQIDESLLSVQVPSMILQPIVENSVNYGIRNIDWEGHIDLAVYRQEDTVCISVADNGVGIPQDRIDKILAGTLHGGEGGADSNGVGMDNVIKRLQLYLGEDDVMSIVSEGENKGTKTTIFIPEDRNV